MVEFHYHARDGPLPVLALLDGGPCNDRSAGGERQNIIVVLVVIGFSDEVPGWAP
jgi:hypothetical protein